MATAQPLSAHPRPDPAGPGQESVWDYPRPPRVEPSSELVVIELGGDIIARAEHSYRVLETSHPPGYYLPRSAFVAGALEPARGSSYCEWKGDAGYLDVVGGGRRAEKAAWHYPQPSAAFRVLRDHVSVYPAAMDRVTVDGELVQAQDGGFYGGWITSKVVGPFKGPPGTWGW